MVMALSIFMLSACWGCIFKGGMVGGKDIIQEAIVAVRRDGYLCVRNCHLMTNNPSGKTTAGPWSRREIPYQQYGQAKSSVSRGESRRSHV